MPDLFRHLLAADRRRDRDYTPAVIGLLALALGASAACVYWLRGLTLSHYDARAHLVVARRILDSMTPGWRQIGAVWLPLPHVLNMLPVQSDLMYRTGASAVMFSVLAFACAAYGLARILLRATGSRVAALMGTAAFAFNPNMVYLQSTPMEESLLLGLSVLGLAFLYDWTEDGRPSQAHAAAWLLAAASLTRFEAWPITGIALTAAAFARWRRGDPFMAAVRRVVPIGLPTLGAIIGFCILSRATVGQWLVTTGFFLPVNRAHGHILLAIREVAWGLGRLSGTAILVAGIIGGGILLIRGLSSRRRGNDFVLIALGACALLPCYAFFVGHPFRIRYMVVLLAFEGLAAGIAVAAAGRWRLVAAAVLGVFIAIELQPFNTRAPMVLEAEWDRPNFAPRHQVTDCLLQRYDHQKILISMGGLAHYMQDMSRSGFDIRDFIHEGNGDIWDAAFDHPRPFVGWIIMETKAQGGDILARRARKDPAFLDGFTRVCSGAGVVLYEKQKAPGARREARHDQSLEPSACKNQNLTCTVAR
jgi:hypothetical protein